MYSNKQSVNILTSILVARGIRNAVVCPGSRNIPIVHNLSECEDIDCHPVTDERSAAFYALGIALATKEPVVVCVTSGSAVLNTSPAVAEAFYRHIPLIVISADRPSEWIDRQDGQTMRQLNSLGNIVKNQVEIEDFFSGDAVKSRHACLLLNTALNAAVRGCKGPVHINMHLDEPLFDFTTMSLPSCCNIRMIGSDNNGMAVQGEEVLEKFVKSGSKMLVIGQLEYRDAETDAVIRELRKRLVVVNEPLSSAYSCLMDMALADGKTLSSKFAHIDFLLSMGGNIVSKRLKKFLRDADVAECWEINKSAEIHDTFMHQTGVICCDEKAFLKSLLDRISRAETTEGTHRDIFLDSWNGLLNRVASAAERYEPSFSQLMAVRQFEYSLLDMEYDYEVHYANSMAVRLGCIYSQHYIWCNRGINGIDGSISTAAGFSLATDAMVFCVSGDLSFFYDQNALWNAKLRGNLRILLINNGGGFIFRQLKGLDSADKSMPYIMGSHIVDAHGICEQNDIGYLSARNELEYQTALVHFLTETTSRPIVFEVFTDADVDKKEYTMFSESVKDSLLQL